MSGISWLIEAGQKFRGESDQYSELITELADALASSVQQHLWLRNGHTFCGQPRDEANPEHQLTDNHYNRPVCQQCYLAVNKSLRSQMRRVTTWLNVDLRFRDRLTGKVRSANNQHVEVVTPAPNQILFQDEESGTHRLVALEHIEGIRLAGHVVWDPATGELT